MRPEVQPLLSELGKEDNECPEVEGYITYYKSEGVVTVRFNFNDIHPNKLLIEDVLIGRLPIVKYKFQDYSCHEYLDKISSHVYRCEDFCKKSFEEYCNRRRKTY